MSTFYDDTELEEELSRVSYPDEDLQFEYLFEYEPPCSDFAAGDHPGLSEPLREILCSVSALCSLMKKRIRK